ncbi:MAG TPA: diguanylate cyclase [candidate division Zixibacteria bacterium]|nr:diguanylate cyclase [candidate division Zixibacteria bacterium]
MPESAGNMPKPPIIRAIISFILIAIVSFFAIQFFTIQIEADLAEHFAEDQEIISKLIAGRTEEFFGDIRKTLSIFAQREGIKYASPSLLRRDMAELYKSIEDMATTTNRMDRMGILLYSQPDTSVIGQSIAHQVHVRKLLDEHCEVISQPIYTVHGYIAIVVHQPVFGADSVFLGSITALIPFDAIEKELLAELDNIGAVGWIVDSTGEILYHPDLATGTLVERAFSRGSSRLLDEFLNALPQKFSGRGDYIDHTGARRPLAIATIDLGDYHWFIATSNRSDELEALSARIRRMANIGYGLLLLVLFGGYLYFGHFVVGKRIREFRKARESSSGNKDRVIELFSRGIRSLITYDSEREALQLLIESFREVGGFAFAGLFIRRDSMNYSLGAQSYLDERNYRKFLDIADIDPFTVKVFADRMHPFVQSLLRGDTVKVVSMEQVSTLNRSLADMGRALYQVLGNCGMFIIPVRAKGELMGQIFCCIEPGEPLREEILAPFIDEIAQVLQVSEIVRQLRESEERFADLFQSLEDGIFMLDSELRLASFNNIAGEKLGLRADLIGTKIDGVFDAIGSSDTPDIYKNVLRNGNAVELEEALFDEKGDARYLRKKIVPLFSSAGAVRRIMTIVKDITSERKLSEELKEASRQATTLAITDGLTGVSNYRHFMENLPKTMQMAKSAGAPLALIILDLDNLKSVNDRRGMAIGDEILQNVAKIISEKCSQADFFGRYGGDDFAILLRNTTAEAAFARAEVIRTNIEDKAGAGGASITASFGIAVLTDEIFSADDFLHIADKALHRAKAEGKNRVCRGN